jgi:hypothetical protein
MEDFIRNAPGRSGADVDFVGLPWGPVVPAAELLDDALSAGSPTQAVAMHLRYLWAAAACLLPTLIGSLLHPYLTLRTS